MTTPGATARDAAVIDIGSNSVRMVLYRLEGRAVWTVFNEKVLAGLGRDLPSTGRLSAEGVGQALTTLKRFAAVLDGVRPDHVLVAATAAVREADDGPAFCARVLDETGLRVRVLSGEDEARHAALGVLAGDPSARGVVADMGGSSLELIRVSDGAAGTGVTLPLGPFSLVEPGGFEPGRLRRRIAARLDRLDRGLRAADLYAVGGAWRSLAQLHMATHDHPLRIVHQYAMGADQARELARLVAQQSRTSLERLPGVSKRRAETLPYAALVLEALIDRLGLQTVHFSAWGLREGLLHDVLGLIDGPTDPLVAGCEALGLRQGISPHLPQALEIWLAPLLPALKPAFGEARDGVMTKAACRLADLGARLHPDHRLELVFDQVLRAPIPGQTHAERAFLACVLNARYGGSAPTPDARLVERLLSAPARERARALGLAIRLALHLSGRSPQLLANAAIEVSPDRLCVTAEPGFADVLLGDQTRRRARALAEALSRELRT